MIDSSFERGNYFLDISEEEKPPINPVFSHLVDFIK